MAGGIEGERPPQEPTPQPASGPDQKQAPREAVKPQEEGGAENTLHESPQTFDGHAPDAWKRSHLIFRRRVTRGMETLRDEIDERKAIANFIGERNRKERAWPELDRGEVDPSHLSAKEMELIAFVYKQGLEDAFNIIVDHINGEPRKKEPHGR